MKRLHEKIAIIHLLLMQSTGLHGLKSLMEDSPCESIKMQSTGLHGLKSFYIIHKRKLQRDAIYGIAWIEMFSICVNRNLVLMQSTGLHGLKFIVCVHFLTFIWMQSTGLYGLE